MRLRKTRHPRTKKAKQRRRRRQKVKKYERQAEEIQTRKKDLALSKPIKER